MDEKSAALELRRCGFKVHERNGVWWRSVSMGYCKPVDPVRALDPGVARPLFFDSLVGYSHVVGDVQQANHIWPVMLMETETLRDFGIMALPRKKRSTVRKALREVRVEQLVEIKSHLEQMNAICVSAAKRTGHGKPPEYYLEHQREWKKFMLREALIKGRSWWGAFDGERLIAYYYAYCIGGTMYLAAAKSHTEGLHKLPNDALLFTFLEKCRDDPECKSVVFGDWSQSVSTLNWFKERYGFSRNDLPVFRRIRGIARLLGRFS